MSQSTFQRYFLIILFFYNLFVYLLHLCVWVCAKVNQFWFNLVWFQRIFGIFIVWKGTYKSLRKLAFTEMDYCDNHPDGNCFLRASFWSLFCWVLCEIAGWCTWKTVDRHTDVLCIITIFSSSNQTWGFSLSG